MIKLNPFLISRLTYVQLNQGAVIRILTEEMKYCKTKIIIEDVNDFSLGSGYINESKDADDSYAQEKDNESKEADDIHTHDKDNERKDAGYIHTLRLTIMRVKKLMIITIKIRIMKVKILIKFTLRIKIMKAKLLMKLTLGYRTDIKMLIIFTLRLRIIKVKMLLIFILKIRLMKVKILRPRPQVKQICRSTVDLCLAQPCVHVPIAWATSSPVNYQPFKRMGQNRAHQEDSTVTISGPRCWTM
jgi:hypothetical protein